MIYIGFDLCVYLLVELDIAKLLLFMIIICLCPVLLLCCGSRVFHSMKPMILTISVGWLITRYCDSQNTYYSIDVLTVHFIVL
jgi:hypothetical protein